MYLYNHSMNYYLFIPCIYILIQFITLYSFNIVTYTILVYTILVQWVVFIIKYSIYYKI